jgi:hypothetical protein
MNIFDGDTGTDFGVGVQMVFHTGDSEINDTVVFLDFFSSNGFNSLGPDGITGSIAIVTDGFIPTMSEPEPFGTFGGTAWQNFMTFVDNS